MKPTNPQHWPLWTNLKHRLKLKLKPTTIFLGCCGSSSSKWVLESTGEQPLMIPDDQILTNNETTMSLATALAADRRKLNAGPTPLKSIVRLFEVEDSGVVNDMCCLCSDRCKGAALIPCGHTYCRVCARAMWSKQEACPVCGRSITEILEIF
ncbi:uncharacterized protein LOC143562517 [Bidens hawaiensis]|uniref:uncharacterized protein LOC143561948 n=1 Tax=Bidens hawaiensis TaxID=980011 RepID=UPI00404B11FE